MSEQIRVLSIFWWSLFWEISPRENYNVVLLHKKESERIFKFIVNFIIAFTIHLFLGNFCFRSAMYSLQIIDKSPLLPLVCSHLNFLNHFSKKLARYSSLFTICLLDLP